MNIAEHCICSSSLWRRLTQRQLLPWLLSGVSLGEHLLEIGAGYGAATAYLNTRVPRVTSLEYDHNSTLKLKLQGRPGSSTAVRGDAARLPFDSQTFSSVLAILVLHHLKSVELQDQTFSEVSRVLRPGGMFIVFEIHDSWFHRIGHIRSTFTPLAADSVSPRLTTAGFASVTLAQRRGGIRVAAIRPVQKTN